MAEVGYAAAALAFAAAIYAGVASAWGATVGSGPLTLSGRRALMATAGLTTLAVAMLVAAFFRHDFSLAYVWQTSSTTTPTFYLLTGLWGGQSGSLLFWSWLTATFGAVAIARRWRADAALVPWFTAVMAGASAFYLFLVVFISNPFQRLTVVPADGNGLNPLLQHPGMAFHPPSLYLGLTGLTVPFAFGIAALITGRLDSGWLTASRRWTLIGWAFLSVGLSLGGRWAYDVLGWGGYWGWDPVENAALMPWIAATAFLHSVMVQERRNMFRVWNMTLVVMTYGLTVLGTFLTRAGLVSSVHAFAQSNIGTYFLVYVTCVLLGSLALVAWRLPLLKDDARIEAALSRETFFLANNVLLLGALFAIFWGTLYPLFREVLTDNRVTVGPPYFNLVVLPIFWAVILLMAIGPLTSWRRTDGARLWHALARPMAVSFVIAVALFAAGARSWIALVGFGTCAFALLVTVLEIGHGVRARRRAGHGLVASTAGLLQRNRRRYGGYIVHVGVILLAMGVIGSNVYQLEADRTLAEGGATTLGDYTLTYSGATSSTEPDRQVLATHIEVAKGGQIVGELAPTRQLFRLREDQPRTIPSVIHRPGEDVYALLGSYDPATGSASFKLYVNPLISLVWLGMITIVLGTLAAAWPDGAEKRVLDAEVRRILASQGAATA